MKLTYTRALIDPDDPTYWTNEDGYRVLLDGRDIGKVWRNPGTPAGYDGAWRSAVRIAGERHSGYGHSRGAAAQCLLTIDARREG